MMHRVMTASTAAVLLVAVTVSLQGCFSKDGDEKLHDRYASCQTQSGGSILKENGQLTCHGVSHSMSVSFTFVNQCEAFADKLKKLWKEEGWQNRASNFNPKCEGRQLKAEPRLDSDHHCDDLVNDMCKKLNAIAADIPPYCPGVVPGGYIMLKSASVRKNMSVQSEPVGELACEQGVTVLKVQEALDGKVKLLRAYGVGEDRGGFTKVTGWFTLQIGEDKRSAKRNSCWKGYEDSDCASSEFNSEGSALIEEASFRGGQAVEEATGSLRGGRAADVPGKLTIVAVESHPF